ncbi:putative membrane protein [Pseudonocardia sp. Ae168_Ps1]|uniref:septum formation family protein n=1 Tax=unclassified Pseudonocardia TaxID=2619320 RepID=UPI00094B4469|nr:MULTISPECIES: septum formation family protein [unclassified Pseudonocardia]OLL75178.1 putative membrane protein [Pseudonocardia sp. Ae150A_Ps1]OLL81172.1 putative membrane protein [Pseudonocardia sp. Ae168_Ps1]OLL84713.1 putative membrane protein [Pseudonocardia sp. Ae263_Ps1]OLL95270.1 putative membrane protein [Pseudonocardia sp. Ae356_Ps1]
MDPSSPAGSAPRRPAETGPETTGEQAYDGYDGRYSRATGGATSVMAPPERATSATPVAPGRRRRRDETDAASSASDDGSVVTQGGSPAGGPFGARRIGIGVLVGAILMFTVASLDSLLGAEVPVLGSFASSGVPRVEEPPPLPPPPDVPGTCLSWDRADATDTAAVNCAQPHLFEQAGRVALADQPVFPTDAAWQKLVADRCTPVATKYLNGKFDPDGKFRVGALKPSEARWNEGDKGMRCGLQMASRSGKMFPITGKVAEQDQSAVQPAGTCLGIDGRTVGDPTDCAGPHAVETVGVVDLGTEFKEGWPAVEDQDKFLQPACTDAANKFAGNDKVIGEKKLTVYWGNLGEESWKAGSRKVNCNIGTLLPDGSGFASVTGSVKGNIVVGDQAAPSAPASPGATASPEESSPPAEGSQAPVEQPESEQPAAPDTGVAPPSLDVPPGLPGLGD